MSCCGENAVTPGTPTSSSGYTAQKGMAAIRCDQAQLLQRLRGACCPAPQSNKSAIYSSVLTQDQATRCQPSQLEQVLTFPKVGVPESVRIQKAQTSVIECSLNQSNPATRYNYYPTFVPQAVCVPPTAEQLNSTTPKPTFWPGCTPQRNIR